MTGRGQVLYDESQFPGFLKRRRIDRFLQMAFSLAVTVVYWVASLWMIVLGEWSMSIILLILAALLFFVDHIAWVNWKLSRGGVKVHEQGIILPPRMAHELKRGEVFLPFDDIEKAYVGLHIAFVLKDRVEHIPSPRLGDPEAFVSAIKGKVEIQPHRTWIPGIGEVWGTPDRLEVHELDFELFWGDRMMHITYDEVVRSDGVDGVNEIVFREGSKLRVRLDRDMSSRLGEAWFEYTERFWRDPEAEEERWEELESEK